MQIKFEYYIYNRQHNMSKSKKSQIPNFIEKLIQMLDDKQSNSIIRWTQDENSFIINSVAQFTQIVLSKYFKHQNYSSFIRQLNMYGFSKIRHQQGDNVYINENFKKGNRSLLKNIKRKLALERQQKEDKLVIYNNNYNNSFNRQVNELKQKQKDLEMMCQHLATQNRKLLAQNNSLMKKMKEQSRQRDKWLEQILIRLIINQKNNNELGNNNSNLLSLTAPMLSQQHQQRIQQNTVNNDQQTDWRLSKILQQDQNMKNLHQMINFMYKNNRNHKKKQKNKNITYVNPQLDQSISGYLNKQEQHKDMVEEPSIIQPKDEEPQQKDKSILSINEFLNIQDSIDFKNKQTDL